MSTSLSAVSDIAEQNIEIWEGKIEKWDSRRTVNIAITGLVTSIISHNWYQFIDHMIPGKTMRDVIAKVACDQTIGAPINITSFIVCVDLLDGKTFNKILETFPDKAVQLFIADCAVWPVAQTINFYFVPSNYRLIYSTVISMFFDAYCSRINYSN
ncbi:protein SYM1-like [Agrilus planipennis]|uniref:Protein SYM1-like n=1 Tax=Agrilus planipennis TaxID=224129 RepID=A0A7F5R1G2_AGRPL|nr:protein SYM1-like [Agrilus planipennis]